MSNQLHNPPPPLLQRVSQQKMTALATAAVEAELLPSPHQQHQNVDMISNYTPLHQPKQGFPDEPTDTHSISRSSVPRPVDIELAEDQQQIDPKFVLPKCNMPPAREYQLVEDFVVGAITSRSSPESNRETLTADASNAKYKQSYRAILDALRRRDDPPMLRKVLLALRTSGNGSTLHQLTSSRSTTHAQLIHFIFRLDPFELPPPIKKRNLDEKETALAEPILDYSMADAHLHLILALVSANSVFLSPAVTCLWKLLMSQTGAASGERIQRVHAALATIIRMCPKAKLEVFPVMASNFPFRTRPARDLIWYCKHCFAVLEYVPAIHGQVIELIIERCLEIDVEIKINDGGEVSFDQEIVEDIFELELDGNTTKPSPTKINPNKATVDEMADKLDSLMLMLFEHIQSRINSNTNTLRHFYDMVTPVFDSSIIITHKSKFVQFIIFLLCGMDSLLESEKRLDIRSSHGDVELYRDFSAKLIEIILDPYRATVTRQSGACYLASFVSRASFVCPETVCETLSALLRWAEAYISSWNPYETRASDSRHQCQLHSLFYTVCQAAFYVMCFQGDEAVRYYRAALEFHSSENLQTSNGSDLSVPFLQTEQIDIGLDRWTKICGHKLQPLRYCLESVRCEFLHVARVFGLIDPSLLDQLVAEYSQLSSRLHTDRRQGVSRISTAATLEKQRVDRGIGGLGRGSNPLDSFFPFDPYLLRLSHSFIDPFYNEWNGPIEQDEFAERVTDDEVDFADAVVNDVESVADEGNGLADEEKDLIIANGSDTDNPVSFVPILIASSATNLGGGDVAESNSNPQPSPITPKKEIQELAWKNSLKRARGYSMENGSW